MSAARWCLTPKDGTGRCRRSCSAEAADSRSASVTCMQQEQQTSATSLAGRVALVTGGSGGIGRAIVLALSAAGVSVAIGYGASDAAAQQLAGQVTAAGGRAAALSADLAYAAEVVRLTEDTEHAFGPVDVLVSNAGTGRRRRLESIEVEEFDEAIAVNLRGPFLLAQ